MPHLPTLFLLLAIGLCSTSLSITQAYQCSCRNYQQGSDCLTDFCTWDSKTSTCSNKACSTFVIKDVCTGLPDPFNCVWSDTTNTCVTFTQCSDYSFNISDSAKCYSLVKCQVDVNNYNSTTGMIKCMDRSIDSARSISDCTKVAFADCFWLVQADGKQCLQNTTSGTCTAQTITQCSDYTTAQCNTLACYANPTTGVCTPLSCTVLPQAYCGQFFNYNQESLTFCTWTGTACVDLDVNA